ncbi:MAG: hypothetical protein LW860_01940 [Xanthomonadaceae bacterium]|jgi:hypothetical protein|nr:hypothetical protein [Xanthomonadaceae bacterium]
MHCSRRSLIVSALSASVAGALVEDADAALRASAEVGARSRFAPLLGEPFVLRDAGAAHVAELVAIRDLPRAGDAEHCFALEFALLGPARPAQATFEIVHPALPRFAALAVPTAHAGDRLVVVFNSPR